MLFDKIYELFRKNCLSIGFVVALEFAKCVFAVMHT